MKTNRAFRRTPYGGDEIVHTYRPTAVHVSQRTARYIRQDKSKILNTPLSSLASRVTRRQANIGPKGKWKSYLPSL